MSFLKKPYFVLLALVAVVTVIILFTYKDYGKTWDENDTVQLGNHALTYYTSFGKDRSYFSFYPQKEFYLTRGPAIETLRAVITSTAHNTTPEFYHLILALFSLTGVIFIYLIVYQLTQKISFAMLGSILLLLLPRVYGDMYTNSKDIAPLYLLLGVIYFSLLYLNGKRNFWVMTFLGILLGLTASLRIILLFVFPLFASFALVQEIFIEKNKRITALLRQIFIGAVTLISLHLFQPYLLTRPLVGILPMLTASKNFPQVMQVLFMGKVYYSNMLRWYYLPWYITITTPVITLVLFALGNGLVIFKRKLSYFYITLLFWIPFLLTSFSHVTLYDAWRQLLFLYAPLTVIAVISVFELIERLPKLNIIIFAVVALGLTFPLSHSLKLHPYEYAYFNEIVGNTKGAYQKYELDYWGESFKEATIWINTHQKDYMSNDGNTHIKPCVHMLAEPYVDPKVKIDDGGAVLYYCINRPILPNPGFFHIVHSVEREGVPLNIISTK